MKQLIKKHRLAVIFTILCLLKIIFRAMYIGDLHLYFLIWNLFLAIVPFIISNYVSENISRFKSKWQLMVIFVIWFLMLPNAFYIFTDFIHLRLSTKQTLLIDFLTILSFATTAWWFGLKSIVQFKSIVVNHFQKKWFEVYDYILPFLMALGVYMGRV